MHFLLGDEHPAYATAPSVFGHPLPPSAWYVRVPDLPTFVRRITPVLEARLAASALAGYSGELPISFYRSGLRLRFDRGQVAVERWPRAAYRAALALFPGLSFTQLLLGYRSLDELEHAFPDCRVPCSEVARLLLTALFPRRSSAVWPIG